MSKPDEKLIHDLFSSIAKDLTKNEETQISTESKNNLIKAIIKFLKNDSKYIQKVENHYSDDMKQYKYAEFFLDFLREKIPDYTNYTSSKYQIIMASLSNFAQNHYIKISKKSC